MEPEKITHEIFPQSTVSMCAPSKDKRAFQGWDVKKYIGRGLKSDTGREIKRDFVSKM